MSDPLTDAANAINSASVNIRKFAQLAAQRIEAAEARVLKLEGAPTGWSVAAPGSTGLPVTTLTDKVLPVNDAAATVQRSDYVVVGSSDSAVMTQWKAAGSQYRRFHIAPCCDLSWANPYARHGFYMDALDLLAEDFYVRTPGGYQIGDGFSIRMSGATVRRFDVAGFPFVVAFYQEYDGPPDSSTAGVTRGAVLVEQGTGAFTNGLTAMWLDTDNGPKVVQAFTFRDLHFTGAAEAKFVAVNHAVWAGTVTVDSCTLNGQRVTSAMCDVPSGLTVL